jgi:hypothetical protein
MSLGQGVELWGNPERREITAQGLRQQHLGGESTEVWVEANNRRARRWHDKVQRAIGRRLDAASSGEVIRGLDHIRHPGDRIDRIRTTSVGTDRYHPDVVEVMDGEPALCAVICATYLERGYHVRLTEVHLRDKGSMVLEEEHGLGHTVFYLIGINPDHIPPKPFNPFSDVEQINIDSA